MEIVLFKVVSLPKHEHYLDSTFKVSMRLYGLSMVRLGFTVEVGMLVLAWTT